MVTFTDRVRARNAREIVMPDPTHAPKITLPLNLGLNDGTYAPQACVDILRNFTSRTSFRNYASPSNDPLRETIARLDRVALEHVFVHNGSGPILKLAIPHLLKRRVLASPRRILRHLLRRDGFPIITPRFTYSKIPKKAAEGGMHVELLPLAASDDFVLDIASLEARLEAGDGLVYLVNPNNPTGNLLIHRPDLVRLLKNFPQSRFWIDEAYVQYIDPVEHQYLSDLVPRHKNLLVGRSFSFAYGLAGVRIGYLLAQPEFIRELEEKITNYRLGGLQEAIAIAALNDPNHLPSLRADTEKARNQLTRGLTSFGAIQVFRSQANFLLCRFTDGRRGSDLARRLRHKKISIKIFEPALGETYDPYFRITTGLPHENAYLLQHMSEILAANRST